ncbi:MAG: hypothetical protein Q8P26_01345 [Candidatus Levybacteria bacterium]|nr:hypothetical protein [Candidatus Levybacteria bacterium]
MWLLGKKNLDKLSPVIHSAYYTKHVKYYTRLFRKSRDAKFNNNPINLMALQIGLERQISKYENLIKEGKSIKKQLEQAGNTKKIKDYVIGIENNKQIVRVIKTICDGIAWRTLGYDRPFLRMMAEAKKNAGSVQFDTASYKEVEKTACAIIDAHNSKVLLNDITHYLRIGDLVEVGKRTAVLEIKKGGKEIKSVYSLAKQHPNAGVSKQLRKITQVQIARDFREILIGSQTIKIKESNIVFQNFLPDVKEIIKKARKNLFGRNDLSDYLQVTCTDQERVIKKAVKTKNFQKMLKNMDIKPHWNKSDLVLHYSNYDSFYEEEGDFFRTSTPYSIYPFEDNDCVGLISGKLLLHSMLNISAIKRIFIKNNWEIEQVDPDKLIKEMEIKKDKIFSGDLYANTPDDTFFIIKRGAFYMHIPGYWMTKISTEFMKVDTLLDYVEEIYKKAIPYAPEKFYTDLKKERKIWK